MIFLRFGEREREREKEEKRKGKESGQYSLAHNHTAC